MILGIDLGRKRHYTVIIGIEEIDNKIVVKLVKSFQNTPFDEQTSAIQHIIQTGHVTKVNIDSGGIGMPIAESLKRKNGPLINPLTFNNELKQKMMVNLRMLFEQKKIVIPQHAQLINSLHKIERKKTETGLEKFEAQEDETGEHGDFAWALAMACYYQQSYTPLAFGFGRKN